MIGANSKTSIRNKKRITVGLIGAGYAARGFAYQCVHSKEIRLAAIFNRTPDNARRLLKQVGADISSVHIADSFQSITSKNDIDVIVEATGDVEFGASVAIESIGYLKHLVLINAELDATLGPILKRKADDAGIIYTQAAGDQPSVIMNLIREVKFIGLKPVLAGNIKTFFNKYSTPDTEREWAEKTGQNPIRATSAVDGTKLSIEMATVANATGFTTATQGMYGPRLEHVDKAIDTFSKLRGVLDRGGVVDYILGAKPAFGVFVIAHTEQSLLRQYLLQYKMGSGPYYTFYRPYHLCTLEAHASIIEAACYGRASLAPIGLYTEVVAIAKRDLKPGDELDGIGGFKAYGVIENSAMVRSKKLLPIGLSRGCKLKKPVSKDQAISYYDVLTPKGRLVDSLYQKQKLLCNI